MPIRFFVRLLGRPLDHCRIAALMLCLGAAPSLAFETPKRLPDGWDGKLELGADATTGASRTSSVSLDTRLSWNAGPFETAARLRLLRASTSLEVARESDGEPVLDAQGDPEFERVSKRTSDRRSLSLEPRWFLTGERRYVFGLFDYETNRPAGVARSTRAVAGVGYRLWNDKSNYLAAGVGIGHKRLEATDGESSDGGIGYFGVRMVLQLNDRASLDAGVDTDFGGDADFTEASLSLAYALRDSVKLKTSYDARVNGGVADRAETGSDPVDGRASIKLEIDLL